MTSVNKLGAQEEAEVLQSMRLLSFEGLASKYSDLSNYCLVQHLGSGKYSDVFEAIDRRDNEHVAIKVLKPVSKRKIRREIKILETLRGGVNIVMLKEVVSNPVTLTLALVMELTYPTDFSDIYLELNDFHIRYYIYELLKALDYCHAHGIMHRDVKPYNIVVDHEAMKLRLIDFGLAEFYRSGEEYSLHVASRHYKGPELLVGYSCYSYSLDIWSMGCMLATMIFRKEPFFNGKNDVDQLVRITDVLGATDLLSWIYEYKIDFHPTPDQEFTCASRKEWTHFKNAYNEHLAKEDALDFLDRVLVFDPQKRITASEAMKHAYFAPLRDELKPSECS
ncbi:Casein kinase II subunit alpha' [Trichuris trichiura]|uniref:Casein kinase II subunit alpha n=1 Tax=Trichuris trichiura TaxID=36087 RepID=A0A077ZEQ7_TRITR|nr:Casein kinase II subunit alpha' [Trichuris trichiura]